MNAITKPGELVQEKADVSIPGLPFCVSSLMAEILKQQEPLAREGALEGRAYDRQHARVEAMQDLLFSLRAHAAEESVMQLIVLSTRFIGDANQDSAEDIRNAVDARVDQLQTILFRLLRIIRLDPAKVGADAYINISAMEPEGYMPPWATSLQGAAR